MGCTVLDGAGGSHYETILAPGPFLPFGQCRDAIGVCTPGGLLRGPWTGSPFRFVYRWHCWNGQSREQNPLGNRLRQDREGDDVYVGLCVLLAWTDRSDPVQCLSCSCFDVPLPHLLRDGIRFDRSPPPSDHGRPF